MGNHILKGINFGTIWCIWYLMHFIQILSLFPILITKPSLIVINDNDYSNDYVFYFNFALLFG